MSRKTNFNTHTHTIIRFALNQARRRQICHLSNAVVCGLQPRRPTVKNTLRARLFAAGNCAGVGVSSFKTIFGVKNAICHSRGIDTKEGWLEEALGKRGKMGLGRHGYLTSRNEW